MKNKLILLLVLVLQTFILFGQRCAPKYIPNNKNAKKATPVYGTPHNRPIKADTVKDLRFKIHNKQEFNKGGDPALREFKKSKRKFRKDGGDSTLQIKKESPSGLILDENNNGHKTTAAPPIYLNHHFNSSDDATTYPNDNSIAISNSGIIISTTNSNITIKDTLGTPLASHSINAFLGGGGSFSGVLYDAKVIYDDILDRFFLVVLDGSTPSTSKLIIAYPLTSNPLGAWSYWTYPPPAAGIWMDYPSIGINASSLYVSINAYNSSNFFQYPIIFRFSKAGILSGSTTGWTALQRSNPLDDLGNQGFTIYPLSYGQAGSYSTTMAFVSTKSQMGNSVQFWTWHEPTNAFDGQDVASPHYEIGGDAFQLGSTNQLDVGDCRVTGGFVINNPTTSIWSVYFTFTSISSASASANYAMKAKLIWNSSGASVPPSSWSLFGTTSGDFCHSNIASYGLNGTDENVIMCSNVSLSTTYPYYVAYSSDASNNYSPSLLIKSGSSFVWDYQAIPYNMGRWGDYTGLCRKQNSLTPIVWASGCYGKADNTGGTWIGEIAKGNFFALNTINVNEAVNTKLYPNPASNNFTLEFNTDHEGICTIEIGSVDGKYSERLHNDNIPEGEHRISLSTRDLPSGHYIVSIILAGSLIKSERLAVVK